jgi:hypothetical protein
MGWSPPLIWQRNLVWRQILVLFGNEMYTYVHVNTHFLLWGVWANLCYLTPTTVRYFGREGWNLYGCLNFRLSYCICNWCWISIVALKVEFDLIVKYFNYINQAYCFQVYSVLLMEGTRNMWSPHFWQCYFILQGLNVLPFKLWIWWQWAN